MKNLKELLENISVKRLVGTDNREVSAIGFDTRNILPHSLFVAQKGTLTDGHQFIENAIEKGAEVIVCQQIPNNLKVNITYIEVADSADCLGKMASAFYGHPSQKLKLVGITGTNGKTTTVTLLHNLFTLMNCPSGLLSTIENKIGQTVLPSTHTTADAVKINELLSQMVEKGCQYCFMEVSSHAIVQQRIAGLTFAGGIFSNITPEHLDYHKTFKEYIAAKKKFFDNLPKEAFALVNIDDKNGKVMLQNTHAVKKTYSLYSLNCDFKAKIRQITLEGINLIIDNEDVWFRLTGEFNAYNLLAIYATAGLLGLPKDEILRKESMLLPAEGRFTTLLGENLTAIVDYAHTPDALENVLTTIEKLATQGQEIITVVGCGGDRDKSKRPLMAKIACLHSNRVILTSDNPRTENPDAILSEMESGIPPNYEDNVLIISHRRQAIKTALTTASKNSIVLIAGKGHEKYQEINGIKEPFDDVEEVCKYLNINKLK
ncbi:MAG: UDP-N-acetylmuramoyl-L-alanyl-D-glutamate--2,6-diaminopimelate ligase [Bacteroidales bacterium]|jgi:UDP-N-acetylmuramoyl-L-alanyl-D-glutamate--2,6-diaminopimelate ligase|nr:UDP-N-acetylmuramoyl-L-alanyl-D-glutamate--2,6-diaminopimelate ligase [Bacteroidales bacterium]